MRQYDTVDILIDRTPSEAYFEGPDWRYLERSQMYYHFCSNSSTSSDVENDICINCKVKLPVEVKFIIASGVWTSEIFLEDIYKNIRIRKL